MIPALCRIALFPGVIIVPTVTVRQTVTAAVRHGEPTRYLPPLSKSDVIYAAGGPTMVEKTLRLAELAGATCFTDPFLPAEAGNDGDTFFARTARWLSTPMRNDPRPAHSARRQ